MQRYVPDRALIRRLRPQPIILPFSAFGLLMPEISRFQLRVARGDAAVPAGFDRVDDHRRYLSDPVTTADYTE